MNWTTLLQYVPLYMRQRGREKYLVEYQDFIVPPGSSIEIPGGTSLFFYPIDNVQISPGVVVESENGRIEWNNPYVSPQLVHTGEIRLTNPAAGHQYLQFLQVIPQ